jgi:hypothetical protein
LTIRTYVRYSQEVTHTTKADLISRLDEVNSEQGRTHRDLLLAMADADKAGVWIDQGFTSMSAWVAARYGITRFKASRYIRAGRRLPLLPKISSALASGLLSLDKTVELTRIARPEDEERLLRWARKVTITTIRERADAAERTDPEPERIEEEARYVWFTKGEGSLALDARMPGIDGDLVEEAIDRRASELPLPANSPDPEAARRADALIDLLTGTRGGDGSDPVVVVHAPAAALFGPEGSRGDGCITETGAPVLSETARRFLCEGVVEIVRWDERGERIVGLGRKERGPSPTLRRAMLYRQDHRCAFHGSARCRMRPPAAVALVHSDAREGPV